jgi:hypothetical protein
MKKRPLLDPPPQAGEDIELRAGESVRRKLGRPRRGEGDDDLDALGLVQELYEDGVLPVREIAQLSGVSPRMIYNYVREGGWRRRRGCPHCAAAADARRRKSAAGARPQRAAKACVAATRRARQAAAKARQEALARAAKRKAERQARAAERAVMQLAETILELGRTVAELPRNDDSRRIFRKLEQSLLALMQRV